MAAGLSDIDWQAPWLAAWRPLGAALAAQVLAGQTQASALDQTGQAPVRFVPQAALPPGMAYERFIRETGCVPTREGLHDFFNGLCWLHLPQTKRQLNQLHADCIAREGITPHRSPLRAAFLYTRTHRLDDACLRWARPAPHTPSCRVWNPLRRSWRLLT